MSLLSSDEFLRYQRQMALPQVGYDGQKKLKQARVLIIGMGGLGSPVSLYLAAAGIGTLGLIDEDHVDVSNLQRQVIYKTADAGRSKVEAAAEQLSALNPHCHLNCHNDKFSDDSAELVTQYDIIAECSDNFKTKYAVNDACVTHDSINVSASIQQFSGHIALFNGKNSPCYRCLFPEINDQDIRICNEAGILGTTAGIAGTLQAQCIVNHLLDINRKSMLYTINTQLLKLNQPALAFNTDCPFHGG
ncbi:MAG: thiamine biosynthesis protein [Coxiella sp. (in: Bacteria)]|nr:MAG: thiamine biosynthesis protein [Coxiella sp. (in: g-proteobacteria)]